MSSQNEEITKLRRSGENAEAESRVDSKPTSLRGRLLREVRAHRFGYSVVAIFVVAGPVLAPLVFPQAPPAAAVVGGLAFGLYAALYAVPQKFL